MKDIVIAIDEGTTNCKAVAFSTTSGQVLAIASRPLEISTPHAGWVEQDAAFLADKTCEVLAEAISKVDASAISCIGISVQRETSLAWRRDGTPLSKAMTWQCARTAEFCQGLRDAGHAPLIKKTTGLPIATLFSGSKMRWVLDHTEGALEMARRGDLCLGTIDAWLLYRLSGGKSFCCDCSDAARTQLMSLQDLAWDPKMLEIFGIPAAALPQICPSSHEFGVTSGVAGVPDGIRICAMVGDSHAALYGHALGALGRVKATYGTGSSIMAPLAAPDTSVEALATTVAWHDGSRPTYGIEGNVAHSGDALKWMTEAVRTEGIDINHIDEHAPDSLGVYFVPFLTGAGAPWWQEQARGVVVGLSRGVTAAHLIRASLESIAYQITDVIEAMRQVEGFTIEELMVDGGPTRNDWLMQFQADLLGVPVSRSDTPELSAIGAGMLALKCGESLGEQALRALIPTHHTFTPDPARHERLLEAKRGWDEAVLLALRKD